LRLEAISKIPASLLLREKVGMGHPVHGQPLAALSFPLRGKVGMGVV
jgi:hypothetical protein